MFQALKAATSIPFSDMYSSSPPHPRVSRRNSHTFHNVFFTRALPRESEKPGHFDDLRNLTVSRQKFQADVRGLNQNR